ncbi:MAG TPA: hypothetical protein VLV25_12800 [Steroidobacteraceae bacterium]|nr:hypothetical protein [Steroidobacteraceae bacterium]
MREIVRATAVVLAIVVILMSAVGAVRWAKRGTPGASFVASAMMLVLGMYAPAIKSPQQGIEDAREDKGKKGSESGDPPNP